ncbi:hypothetical protein A2442_00050 [Candidatus Campbellbacteria bacterium RIFOXYC2_FULL_35_25]|uniref:Uncharacterized protein n=1 Tax=Candidatus Campbellbacteria bacterium RIFOXYC2_FULL_35_25 TaxID=1797582 RepID=A0A1F5EIB9_9BACT|nr:MAG: hypothetical protein A2442_00050 [Candidatus Campbellbacteria bacterium RIFOXYC2_FULL_35_25]
MLSNKIKKIIFLGALFLPFWASAQFLGSDSSLYVKIDPKFPKPNQEFSVSIESYVTDLNLAETSWFKNGTLVEKGFGLNSFTFKAGGLGSSVKINIQVKTSNKGTLTKIIEITPAEVDLFWEANSSVPPLYKGKALSSYQSDIKIIAVPNFIDSNGYFLNSKDLIYRWKKDMRAIGDSSGIGRNVLILKDNKIPSNQTISVEVETKDGKMLAGGNLNVVYSRPEIVFYEKNPLLGVVYEKALETPFILTEEEASIVAQPFFFSKDDIFNGNLVYKWLIDNKEIEEAQGDNIMTLRRPEKGSGSINLNLGITNFNRIMQFANNQLKINLGELKGSNLFNNI